VFGFIGLCGIMLRPIMLPMCGEVPTWTLNWLDCWGGGGPEPGGECAIVGLWKGPVAAPRTCCSWPGGGGGPFIGGRGIAPGTNAAPCCGGWGCWFPGLEVPLGWVNGGPGTPRGAAPFGSEPLGRKLPGRCGCGKPLIRWGIPPDEAAAVKKLSAYTFP
jgi:hypothetical protein